MSSLNFNVQELNVITAIKTPYDQNGKIDFAVYDSLITRQINAGIKGVVVAGTTGEGHLMESDEILNLIEYTSKNYGKDLYIIGNTGGNNTQKMQRLTKAGFDLGMNASLQVNPYYGKTSRAGMMLHFEKALECGSAIIYNVPSRTAQDIEPKIILDLFQHPNFLGVKECAGCERIKTYTTHGLTIWSGNDEDCFYARKDAGATGIISIASNLVPQSMLKMISEENANTYQELKPLFDLISTQPNPIVINTLLSMCKIAPPVFRLPYTSLGTHERKSALNTLHKLPELKNIQDKLSLLNDGEFKLF